MALVPDYEEDDHPDEQKENYQEVIPADRAIFQEDERARTYQCPYCFAPLFSQYTGKQQPVVTCRGPLEPHILKWYGVGFGKMP